MKILTVLGARPQFIKAAAISLALQHRPHLGLDEVIVHTGQHFDFNMSEVFFEQLSLPAPRYNLAVSGGGHGDMTGRMMHALEPIMIVEQPDWVLVYGDTNSTLAGALVAAKLDVPIAHVEAGLRSGNRKMPEEINRVLTDRVSALLFCPTAVAVENLRAEGIIDGVRLVGDVMYDVALHFQRITAGRPGWPQTRGLKSGGYILVTCHRAENTDDRGRLEQIFSALSRLSRQSCVVVPLHPRTRKAATEAGLLPLLNDCLVIEPVSYLDMLTLEQDARAIVTDSGGMQKEAFFFRVPCITIRDETEWLETVELGWNRLVAADADAICDGVSEATRPQADTLMDAPYGQGESAIQIVELLAQWRSPSTARR